MPPPVFLSIKRLNTRTMPRVASRNQVIKVAAMHNLRELAAEFGPRADTHIDPSRLSLNYALRGPTIASEVAQLAFTLLDSAGVTTLRKDAVMAVEVLLSLPAVIAIHHRVVFEAFVHWVEEFYCAPILSAVVHMDEASPHCHVLILPLVNGRMNGGRLVGNRGKILAMHSHFHQAVGKRFGLGDCTVMQRRNQADAHRAGTMLVEELRRNPKFMLHPDVRRLLIPMLGNHADEVCRALGLGLEDLTSKKTACSTVAKTKGRKKTFVELMTAPCKPKRRAESGRTFAANG